MLLNKWINIYPLFILSVVSLFYFIYLWLVDLVVESTWLGKYNRKLRSVIVAGFILFLASEVFLFGGFFWAYFDRFFHLPAVTGSNSISLGVEVFVWYKKPLYGTIVLLFSTVAFNGANYCMKWGSYYYCEAFFAVGLFLGFLFLVLQATEYIHLSFNISDSVYSSCFYLLTGFHGFHVVVGLIFLTVQVWRFSNNHFTRERHLGLLLAMMYWHFVDIVWIFLFIFVYLCNNCGFPQYITV
jgi:heme/copper-type cytochrome/quinol oxidase subunit 3